MLMRLPDADHVFERVADIGDDRQVDPHRLVHRRTVDVDMDLLAVRAERIQPPGDAIVEPRADRDHQIGLVHRVIGFIGAVHAEHAEPLIGRGGKGAQAHQRRRHRRAGDAGELAQQLAGARTRIDDAAAGVEDRPFGRRQHLDRRFDQFLVRLDLGAIGFVLDRAGLGIARGRDLNILGDVDDDRAGAAGGGDMKRLMHHAAEVAGGLHQIIMLGAVAGDADRVRLLKRIRSDQVRRDLAGDDHHRDRIHQRVGDAGDGIGRSGAGGDEHDAGLAGGAGIALCRMRRRLFVAHQDVADLLLVEDRVVNRKHRAAGIAEHDLHTEVGQRLDQNVRAALLRHNGLLQ